MREALKGAKGRDDAHSSPWKAMRSRAFCVADSAAVGVAAAAARATAAATARPVIPCTKTMVIRGGRGGGRGDGRRT